MKLPELAFACYIYKRMTDNDSSYRHFLKETNHAPDIGIAKHRIELLKWLNKWGCRQFAKNYHGMASDEIRIWYGESGALLPPPDKALPELSDVDINSASVAYERLAERTASKRSKRNGGKSTIRFGPTGASKVLFAIRPNALISWDAPIRERFEWDGLAKAYADYLGWAQAELKELGEACERNGYNLSILPELIGRPDSSITKLVDEYLWVKITRNCPAPTDEIFMRWASWE